ncbi:MAG TPA: hypothetical protein VHE37_11215 [Nevskiaceae bacterium]|nr:hypothetical protein [Nevskiaceae bacterium]
MKPLPRLEGALVKLLGSALIDQALLSACNFLVSVLLIRMAADHQYGYYVLATNAVLLLVTLQNAFFGAPLVNALTRRPLAEHAPLVEGLNHDQQRYLLLAVALCLAVAAAGWISGLLAGETALVLAAFGLLMLCMLTREFFRAVLIARRCTHDVLRADAMYVAVLVAGVCIAARGPAPAAAALVAMSLAALAGVAILRRAARSASLLGAAGTPGTLRRLAPLGAWAAAGGAIHWTFSQGYSYLVAGTLDLAAVAAIAAIRLLMMPLNLLSTGMYQLMMPTVSRWLHDHGPQLVLKRLLLVAAAFMAVAALYFVVVWLLREWIFGSLLKKQFEQRDLLLCLWAGIFFLMVMRDQLIFLPVLAERFRELAGLALACAVLALSVSFIAVQRHGAPGALLGMLVGEAADLAGILYLGWRETRLPRPAPLLAA